MFSNNITICLHQVDIETSKALMEVVKRTNEAYKENKTTRCLSLSISHHEAMITSEPFAGPGAVQELQSFVDSLRRELGLPEPDAE